MNVTEEMLRKYLETFTDAYISAANKYLPDYVRQSLVRYSLIQGKTIGYVSTQFGAGLEFVPGSSGSIEIVRSSARIEDFFFGAPNQVSKLQPGFLIGGSNTTIANLSLTGGFPLRLTTDHASVRLISVHSEALNWSRDIQFGEIFANRKSDFWIAERAIQRATDEIFQAIVDVRQAERRSINLHEYLGQFKEKTVLVLGDYSKSGRARLEAIKVGLDKLGYDPILLDEIPENPHYSLSQKAVAVGAVSRFVVVDDSSRSGHLVEFVHVQTNDWVTVVLRLEDSEGSFLTRGASAYSTVITEQTYTFEKLPIVLQDCCDWAEKAVQNLRKSLDSLYPWRRS